MFNLINKGDFIAHEFTRLMGHQGVVKTASDKSDTSEHVHNADCYTNDCGYADDAMDYDVLSDENLADMVLDDSADDVEALGTPLDGPIEQMQSYSSDPEHKKESHNIILGLQKIASSLRGKGESFAADVVEATSLSIANDLQKEAAIQQYIVSSLTKIASEFEDSNDTFAADLVRVTINKIN